MNRRPLLPMTISPFNKGLAVNGEQLPFVKGTVLEGAQTLRLTLIR